MATLDDVVGSVGRRAVLGRRSFIAVLVAFVLAGATGLLGVREATTATSSGASASSGGYELTVTYASVARAGLDVPLVVTVHRRGGFGKELVLGISADYLDIFETQGFNPDPTEATRDGDLLRLTFAAPPGETFRFSYDAYIQPSSQQGEDAIICVLEDGRQVASVSLTTHLVP